jgi:hypothetical protein
MPHVPRSQDDEYQRLPLRAELFLIAHDDDTGRRHIDKRRLGLGLAAAVLLELWLARRIRIGWRPDARYAAWHPNPGQITILDASPTGDPIIDAALRLLWNLGGTPRISDFVRQFAATNLYDRVRGQMIATGILRRATRRRFRFFRAETYLSSHPRFPVRARTGVRNLTGQAQPRQHDIALAGLVTGLGLTRYLYPPDMSPAELQRRLAEILRSQHSVREVAGSVTPGRKANSAHRHR